MAVDTTDRQTGGADLYLAFVGHSHGPRCCNLRCRPLDRRPLPAQTTLSITLSVAVGERNLCRPFEARYRRARPRNLLKVPRSSSGWSWKRHFDEIADAYPTAEAGLLVVAASVRVRRKQPRATARLDSIGADVPVTISLLDALISSIGIGPRRGG